MMYRERQCEDKVRESGSESSLQHKNEVRETGHESNTFLF